MDVKKYNNVLSCRKYYEKKKNNLEFMLRKRMNEKRSRTKREYLSFLRLFPLGIYPKLTRTTMNSLFHIWKELTVKGVPDMGVIQMKADRMKQKRNLSLLKCAFQVWKEYERTPVIRTPIICSFF